MKLYQLTYLISPDISEEELKETCQKVETLIQENGGSLERVENPAKKRLGYLIKNKGSAFLSSLNFYLESQKLELVKQKLSSAENILRFMLVSKSSLKAPVKPRKIFPVTKKWIPKKEKKVDLKEIEKKLGEILGE